jgi:hypothetical protein
MNLDDKLREIVLGWVLADLSVSEDKHLDKMIAQIKQAFKDEGYKSDEYTKTLVKATLNEIHEAGYMTNQDWYKRFIKEWDQACTAIGTIAVTEDLPYLYGRLADQAARKAAGL